jgi:hypothetical protein
MIDKSSSVFKGSFANLEFHVAHLSKENDYGDVKVNLDA